MRDLQEMVFTIQAEDVGGFAVRVEDVKELLEEWKAAQRELLWVLKDTKEESEQ